VLVVPLRVNVNLKAVTVEEKEAQRKVTVILCASLMCIHPTVLKVFCVCTLCIFCFFVLPASLMLLICSVLLVVH
jgi:hypothetical protein